jgi:methionine-rich copper-binding protein CopC
MICSPGAWGVRYSEETNIVECIRKICLSLLLTAAAAGHAHAHAFLDHAEPAVGSNAKQTPHAVKIWFTEPIQPAVSTITVFNATQKQIDKRDTHCDGANKALLQVSLPSLGPGLYQVRWRVMSVDGHSTGGDFAFRVAP